MASYTSGVEWVGLLQEWDYLWTLPKSENGKTARQLQGAVDDCSVIHISSSIVISLVPYCLMISVIM